MNDLVKVKPSHTQRTAFVYIRQSSPAQVEYNRESTARQYALLEKAQELGWIKDQVIVIDEDLGVSGSGFAERSGFARMIAEVALGHVGIVFALEVSRVARNNADWYRLFDLCSITDTLVGDSDGINLAFPLRAQMQSQIRWVPPSYHTIHQVLTNPVYAGAYAYGKSHRERYT